MGRGIADQAAGLGRAHLGVVADQREPAAGIPGRGDELVEYQGRHHRGFIDDHDTTARELDLANAPRRDRVRRKPGLFIGDLRRRRRQAEYDGVPVGVADPSADRLQHRRLAGTGRADHDVDASCALGDGTHRADLIVAESRVAHRTNPERCRLLERPKHPTFRTQDRRRGQLRLVGLGVLAIRVRFERHTHHGESLDLHLDGFG